MVEREGVGSNGCQEVSASESLRPNFKQLRGIEGMTHMLTIPKVHFTCCMGLFQHLRNAFQIPSQTLLLQNLKRGLS